MKEYFLGIDLGGTRVKMGIVSEGKVIAKQIVPAQSADGLAASLPQLKQEMERLMNSLPSEYSSFGGVGLAFPGLVNTTTKRILSTNKKYDDAPGLDLNQWVSDQWNVPFFLDNDARMATVGEWKYGAGTDTDDLVVMTIGTGIGTSAVIEGKLLRGKHYQAGCLGGHFSIQINGRQCSCGNLGCVEAHGSTWSLVETIRNHPGFSESMLSSAETLDFSSLFEAAEANDALAKAIRQYCLDVWSAGIVNLIHAYDPEVVVIGGGVMNSAAQILPYLQEKVKKHAWTPWGTVELRTTRLAEDAGILGVAHCITHNV